MTGRTVTWGFREVLSGIAVAGLGVLAMWLIFSIAQGLPGTGGSIDGRNALLISAGFEFFFVAVALWYAVVSRRGSLSSLGFVRPRSAHPMALAIVAWLIGIGASFGWVVLVEQMGWESLRPRENAQDILGADVELWLTFVVVGLVAPFTEEIFFRGFAFSGLRRSFTLVPGVVLSAALFAVFHVDPTIFVPIFIFGIVLAWLFVHTGSIYPPMFAHALNNVVVLAIASSGLGR